MGNYDNRSGGRGNYAQRGGNTGNYARAKGSSWANKSPIEKVAQMDESGIAKLAQSGQLDEFQKLQQPGFWDGLKQAGTTALDVMSRIEATSAGFADELINEKQGIDVALTRAAKELFTNDRQRETIPDVFGQAVPGYQKFREEHPIASMPVDFGLSIGLDPTTYTGFGAVTKLAKGGLGLTGKVASKTIGKTKSAQKAVEWLENSFDTGARVKRGVKNAGYDASVAKKILESDYEIALERRHFDKVLRGEDVSAGRALTTIKKIRGRGYFDDEVRKHILDGQANSIIAVGKNLSPEENAEIMKNVMEGTIDLLPSGHIKDMAQGVQKLNQKTYEIYADEMIKAGKTPSPAMLNYLHNNPYAIGDYTKYGEKVSTGHSMAFQDFKAGFEKEKKLDTFDKLKGWWEKVGLDKADIPKAAARNLDDMVRQNIDKVKTVKSINSILKIGQDSGIVKKLERNVDTVFQLDKNGDIIVPKGYTLFMPKGNLRFFPIEIKDILGKEFIEQIDDIGGEISPDIATKIMQAVDNSVKTVVDTTTNGIGNTTGPLKQLESVVQNALQARGMSAPEAMVYINKLKGAGGGLTTVINNTTTIDKGKLGVYIEMLLKESNKVGVKLSPEISDKLNKIILGVSSNVDVYSLPVELAQHMQGIPKAMKAENAVNFFDRANNIFKNTAILSPGFHLRNNITAMMQNYNANMDYRRYADAYKYFKDGASVLGKSKKEWDELLSRYGVTSGSFVGQDVKKLLEDDTAFKRALNTVPDFSRKMGKYSEQFHRAALFMDGIKKGMKPIESAVRVKDFHFDYAVGTEFEKTIAKRLFPFYTWSRNNIPLQLNLLMNAPMKFRNLQKLKESIQGDAETQNNPDWWKNQDVWTTKFDAAVNVGLPYADLNVLGSEALTGSTGILGGGLQLMMGENGSGYDFFYDKPIREFKGQTEPLIAGKYLNVDPKFKFALESFLPITKRYGTDLTKELYNVATGENQADAYRLLGKAIGLKIIPNVKDIQEKQKIYKLYGQLKDFIKLQKQQEKRGGM